MSGFQQKENSGSLFKNDRKERENQPDYTGSGKFNGVEGRLSAWVKESQNGKKYFSISFTPADEMAARGGGGQGGGRPAQQQSGGGRGNWDQGGVQRGGGRQSDPFEEDSIPF